MQRKTKFYVYKIQEVSPEGFERNLEGRRWKNLM
jgi:hypothetical protein